MIDDLSEVVLSYMNIDVKLLHQWEAKGENVRLNGIAVLPLPAGRSEIFVSDTGSGQILVLPLRGGGGVPSAMGTRGNRGGRFPCV